jgi:hypothetical protein
LLLGESVGKGFTDTLIFEPQGLVLTGSNFDVRVVLHKRHDLVDQNIAADRRVVVPVVAVGRLSRVDIPFIGRIALGHDLLHQLQRTGHDGAAGFPRVEKLFFIHFPGAGVMADEHHVDLVVVPLEKQVQQDEKALGDVLGRLGHRTGHVHQAKHHGLGAGVGLFDQQVVFQVEGVEERHAVNARAEFLYFCLDGLDIAEVVWFFAF